MSGLLAVGLAALLVVPAGTAAWAGGGQGHGGGNGHGGGHGHGHGGGSGLSGAQEETLLRYAEDTWASMAAMADDETGLVADQIDGELGTASEYTSPTNIGGYLWSTVVARDLGVVSKKEARERIRTTLGTLSEIERHEPSGMFYNWYSPGTGEKLTTWPDSGDVVHPFLSTVDNGWLAASLRVVSEAEPSLRKQADALYDSMDFGWFHDTEAADGAGLNRGGFWVDRPGDTCTVSGNYGDASADAADVLYTCHWYDTTVSEARIATYLGIANGQIPPEAYYGTLRTMPAEGCAFAWQEQKPEGVTREYDGVSVFEGTYEYGGQRLVPAWGGSMFEALMPDLFVPEAQWGPRSWGLNHPATVAAQEYHGLEEADYGYWGFSPASDPFGGYREYGVEGLGISSDGYASDEPATNVDRGYEGCREATDPEPTFGEGVVTPHASFLALPYDSDGVLENLDGIENDLDAYGPGGFFDAVSTDSATAAERYLSLDQSMIMAAIGNALDGDSIKDYFVDRSFERIVKPLVAQQVFGTTEP
ncbi:glucoamylase family protein [Labedella phragmitis]|nr:glucoamylase family protein [Labedella phragmitis]